MIVIQDGHDANGFFQSVQVWVPMTPVGPEHKAMAAVLGFYNEGFDFSAVSPVGDLGINYIMWKREEEDEPWKN